MFRLMAASHWHWAIVDKAVFYQQQSYLGARTDSIEQVRKRSNATVFQAFQPHLLCDLLPR